MNRRKNVPCIVKVVKPINKRGHFFEYNSRKCVIACRRLDAPSVLACKERQLIAMFLLLASIVSGKHI